MEMSTVYGLLRITVGARALHHAVSGLDDSIANLQNALTEYEITATSSSKRSKKDN
jgi:hypothetical protein